MTTRNDDDMTANSLPAPLFLGIDGGGTKTSCVVLNEAAQVVGQGRRGSSNRNSVGDATAAANVAAAIDDALAAAGAAKADVAALCLGMSGVGRPADRALVAGWMDVILPGVPTAIYNDAIIALASGTRGRLFGIVIVSGTGMIVYGFDANGGEARAGGWGPLLGDEGGGYAIGAAVLKAATAAVDDRGPQTALQPALLQHLGLAQPSDLVTWAYAETGWDRIAQLAVLAAECATQGDLVANAILDQAAADLAVAAAAVARRLNLTDAAFPLVFSGGNLRPGPLFERLTQKLAIVLPTAQIRTPQVEPAEAAALLALQGQ
ncbi:MAG: BadF/BadG/BcrA/BcrD ATPase family protein [Caldilineaceae bacterium]